MKKTIAITCILLLTVIIGAGYAVSSEAYRYIDATDMNQRLKNRDSMIIVDICSPEQFKKGHIHGAIETNAYPVKTEAEKARLGEHLQTIKGATDDVVIVCPGGGGGARRTYDYYKSGGVAEDRLLILKKGMNNWPYDTDTK